MMLIVWIPILILVAIVLVRLNDNNGIFNFSGKREAKESPIDILKRRYANGEITTAEYQEQIKKIS